MEDKENRGLSEYGISQLYKVLTYYPGMRLGQVLTLAARLAGWTSDEVFYCPDNIVVRGLSMMARQTEFAQELEAQESEGRNYCEQNLHFREGHRIAPI